MDDYSDVSEMTSFDVARVDAVGTPANGTDWLILKSRQQEAEKAKLDAKHRNALPDSDFAYIDSKGGRHLPVNDAEHVRAALSRFDQTHFESAEAKEKAHRKVLAAASKFGVDVSDDDNTSKAVPDSDEHSGPQPATGGPLPTDGGSDSLGPQNMSPDQDELTRQTAENCHPDDAPHAAPQETLEGRQAQKKHGKKKRSVNNPDATAATADTAPGSDEWEHKDVALGEETIATLEHALQLARTFTEREKSEATAPDLTKEITDMTRDELVKLLDERDEARRAEKDTQPDPETASKKSEAKAARKAAKKAAKAQARIEELEKRLAEVEAQPARSRPVLSGAVPRDGGQSAFKSLEDRIAQARTAGEELDARQQLSTAKMIAFENARERGDVPQGSKFGPQMAPMLTPAHMIGDDSTISGV